MPVTLKYKLFSIWTEIFFNVKIFNFFSVWINKVFPKNTSWIWNRFDIVNSIGRPICLIFLQCDDLLKYIESSKFRIVHIFVSKVIWQHKCDWHVFRSKVFWRSVCVRLLNNRILSDWAIWSIDHHCQFIWEQKYDEGKNKSWDYATEFRSKFFFSLVSHCDRFCKNVNIFEKTPSMSFLFFYFLWKHRIMLNYSKKWSLLTYICNFPKLFD